MKTPKRLTAPEPDTRKELYFELESYCHNSYSSNEQFGDWEAHYNTKLGKVSRNKELLSKWAFEALKVEDKVYDSSVLYVIWVQYSDGDTFGHSTGQGKLAYATEDSEEALEVKKQIESGKSEWMKSPKSLCSYACWTGYFNSVEDVHLEFKEVLG